MMKSIPPELEELNRSSVWLASIERDETLSSHVPNTTIVYYDHFSSFQRESEVVWIHPSTVRRVEIAAYRIGFPVFVRTDLVSAKHSGPNGYRIDATSDVARVLSELVESAEGKLSFSPLRPKAFLVREWIDIRSSFSAFDGMAIGREWRIFATRDRVLCRHFYWPSDALRFLRRDFPSTHVFSNEPRDVLDTLRRGPSGWRASLRALERGTTSSDLERLEALATRAARVNASHDVWSVDFAQDTRRFWWLIDMAIGERSWHPESCPNHETIRRGYS